MIDNKQLEVLKAAIEAYGKEHQVDRAIEEMAELTKALCKERRAELTDDEKTDAVGNIIEETADVLITLYQVIMLFEAEQKIQPEVDYKIARLKRKLEKRKGATVATMEGG